MSDSHSEPYEGKINEPLCIPEARAVILRNLFSKTKRPEGCWIWTAAIRATYPQFGIDGSTYRAHRLFYEWFKAPIPEGYTIDHVCRNRLCVNPDHLEAVTQRENVLRGDSLVAANGRKRFCKRGHEFTSENTGYFKNQAGRMSRRCRTCARAR
jgi:hypothetical protein